MSAIPVVLFDVKQKEKELPYAKRLFIESICIPTGKGNSKNRK
jgi:hypothetical protein